MHLLGAAQTETGGGGSGGGGVDTLSAKITLAGPAEHTASIGYR